MPMMGMQWVRKYHWSMRNLFYPSFAGTLTHIKLIATFVSVFLPPCLNISELLFLFLVRMIRSS
jgi:hypothetical protein